MCAFVISAAIPLERGDREKSFQSRNPKLVYKHAILLSILNFLLIFFPVFLQFYFTIFFSSLFFSLLADTSLSHRFPSLSASLVFPMKTDRQIPKKRKAKKEIGGEGGGGEDFHSSWAVHYKN